MSCQAEILNQLRAVRSQWEATHVVIEDYQVALRKSLELEVRVTQLSRENLALRDECNDKDDSISSLTQKVVHAQEDIRREYDEAVKEKEALLEERSSLMESLAKEIEERGLADESVERLQSEKEALQTQLEEACTATSLAVSEMKTGKEQTEEALIQLRQLEAENHALTHKIKCDQEKFCEKWQEVNEMEESVQRRNAEVEILRTQLSLEREMQNESSPLLPWKKKQNPFAKRLASCGRLIERNDTEKALQALDVLLIEMKDLQQQAKHPLSRTKTKTDGGFVVLEEEEEDTTSRISHTPLPKESSEGHMVHQGGCTSCISSPTETLIATGGADKKIFLWEPSSLTVQTVLSGMAEGVRDVAFTAGGETVLAAGADKTVRMWHTSSGRSSHVMTGHSRSVNCIACDPGNAHKAVSCGEDRHIRFWDLHRGYQIQGREIRLQEWTNAICYSSAGDHVISGHSKGSLKLWDARSSEASLDHPQLHDDPIVALRPLPMTSHLLLTAGRDNRVKLYDLRKNGVVFTFQDPQFVIGTTGYLGGAKASIDISGDEQLIAAGSSQGWVMVWNADGKTPTAAKYLQSKLHTKPVVATGWSSERLFSCDQSGKIVIWSGPGTDH